MAFLRNLAKLFSQAPLTVELVLAPGGVRVVLGEGTRLLDPAEVMSDWVQRRLPPPLAAIFADRAAEPGPAPLIALTHAQKLRKELQRYTSDKLQVDDQALATLRFGPAPALFRIHWRYVASQQRLEPQYIGADHHLGYGWFHRAEHLWRLDEAAAAPLLEWLNRTWITSTEIYRFVATILLAAQRAHLPVSCDLSIESGFQVQLTLANLRPWSLEVRLTSNQPTLLPDLQFLNHEPLHMISGTTILPGLAPRMTPQIYRLAHRQRGPIFENSELAELIAYELKPTAALWGLDERLLTTTYPMLDAATFDLVWQGEQEIERGIGGYQATPWLAGENRRLPFATLLAAVENDVRFIRLDEGWLELTEAYKQRHREWAQRPLEPFQLSVAEVLGVATPRLRATGLPSPQLSPPAKPTAADTLPEYLSYARQHGLPAAILGMETALPALLVELVRKMIQLTSDLRVLWVVTKARQGEVQAELKKAGLTVFTAFPAASRKALPGGVYLTQPAAKTPPSVEWDLALFTEIDTLAATEEAARRLRAIKRRWALATFGKTVRGDVDHQLLRPMQILQVGEIPVPLFRQFCLITERAQSTGLLAQLVSPFRKIVGAEETRGRGVAIPGRRAGPPPAPPVQIPREPSRPVTPRPPARPTFTLDAPTTVLPGSFIEQARLLVDRALDQAAPVPFVEHWPTYTAMDQAQLRWYFFWRGQARQGNFLPTDLSYLLLHVYEAINLIGFPAPQPTFDYLARFGEHYRATQPKLEQRLTDWLADFLVVYRLPQSPLDWYAQLAGAGQRLADLDLTVEAWLHSGGDFTQLNPPALYELAGYAPHKSQFYQENNPDGRLDQAYQQGLQAVYTYVQQQTQQTLFDQHRPAVLRAVARPPFADARYGGNKAPIKIANVYPWSAATRLTGILQQIIKYTENVQRQAAGFKGRLRGIELPADWTAAIDRAFTQPEPRRAVTIDLGKVAALQSDADALRERLIVEEEEALADSFQAGEPTEPQPPVTPALPSAVEWEDEALRMVVGAPQSPGDRLLRLLWQQGWLASTAQLAAAVPGHFLHVVIDEINGWAVDQLGDALLLESADGWQVNEEYQAGLARIFDHASVSGEALLDASPELSSVDNSVPPKGTPHFGSAPHLSAASQRQQRLDPAWTNFAEGLQPRHWELLRALLQGAGSATLDTIARQGYSTANQLIDEINAAALDYVGDLVIDTSSNPPAVMEEAAAGLRLLVEREE